MRSTDAQFANLSRVRGSRDERREIAHLMRWGFYERGPRKGLPKPKSPTRRNRLGKRGNLAAFCTYYFPEVFYRPFSRGQIDDLGVMDNAIHVGGQSSLAAPRGDGKTSRVVAAVLKAVLYGLRRFVPIVGADLKAAKEIMEACKMHLRTNERLERDFPEVCIPAQAANDIAARASGLMLHGEPLRFRWSKDETVLPTIAGSPSSGAIIAPFGLTGRLRGMFRPMEDGSHLRPDLFVVDDPQTDESAKSPAQCDTREKLILGAVLGAGGDAKIACYMPCTVIEINDVAHRFLDREKHPDFMGRKRSMVINWPKAQDTLWEKYHDTRRTAMRDGDSDAAAATEYYREHREAMDEGAILDNEHRKEPGDLSALQHAENLLCDRGREVFYAEYQNEPERGKTLEYVLEAETVASRCNGLALRTCPKGVHFVPAFIDLNHYGLHWVILGATANLTGYVLDYGRFPGDHQPAVPTGATPSEAAEAMYAALDALVTTLARFDISRDGGTGGIDVVLVDCGYMPDVVFHFAANWRGPFKVMPSRGRGSRHYRQTSVIGQPHDNCHKTEFPGKGRVIVHNSDYWRSNTQRAFLRAPHFPGSISLPGKDARDHAEYGQHIVSEKLIRFIPASATIAWNTYDWQHQPGTIWDYLDASVGCMVGACMMGGSLGGVAAMPRRARAKPQRRKAKVKRQ